MLKGEIRKLEPRTEVCMFVGYPKGIRGGLFNSSQEKKVFLLTNATFFETDYMTKYKPPSKVVLEDLFFRSSHTTIDNYF